MCGDIGAATIYLREMDGRNREGGEKREKEMYGRERGREVKKRMEKRRKKVREREEWFEKEKE